MIKSINSLYCDVFYNYSQQLKGYFETKGIQIFIKFKAKEGEGTIISI